MAELASATVGEGKFSPVSANEITLRINGATHTLSIEPRVSLLDALRESLGLTGTKKGCNQGACGACTVLVDGQRTLSCLTFAIQYEGDGDHDRRRPGSRWRLASDAKCIRKTRWFSMRLLHPGANLFGDRDDSGVRRRNAERCDRRRFLLASRIFRRRDQRTNER